MAIFKKSFKTVQKFSGGTDTTVTKEKIKKGEAKKKIEEMIEAKEMEKELSDF